MARAYRGQGLGLTSLSQVRTTPAIDTLTPLRRVDFSRLLTRVFAAIGDARFLPARNAN